jgi:hypothetical protein
VEGTQRGRSNAVAVNDRDRVARQQRHPHELIPLHRPQKLEPMIRIDRQNIVLVQPAQQKRMLRYIAQQPASQGWRFAER